MIPEESIVFYHSFQAFKYYLQPRDLRISLKHTQAKGLLKHSFSPLLEICIRTCLADPGEERHLCLLTSCPRPLTDPRWLWYVSKQCHQVGNNRSLCLTL